MPPTLPRLAALRISTIGVVAALGGGLAGALLAMLTLTRPPLTLLMGFFAPLPLMIATLGFGALAGVLAMVVGAVFVALFDLRLGHLVLDAPASPLAAGADAAVFLLVLGLPSLVLGLVARHGPAVATTPQARPAERLLGRVAVAAVVFAAVSVSVALALAIFANGGREAYDALLTTSFEKVWRQMAEQRALPAGVDAGQVAREMVLLMPPLMSAATVFFYLANLWLAARIAQVSELLGVPWPDVPGHMRVPRLAALLLAVSLGLSLLPGSPGLICRIVSAALLAVLAIQGLAVAHALTRGRASRLPTLLLVYLTAVALLPAPLLLWCLVGLLDTAFSFRDRQKPPSRKP